MRHHILLLATVLLAACGPASISRDALEAALYADGDMPAAWGPPGQIVDETAEMNSLMDPDALMAVYREFGDAGHVSAFVYASPEDAEAALVTLGYGGRTLEDGANNMGWVTWRRGRCLGLINGVEGVEPYAQRLDRRLEVLGC